ncbi:MAG: DegV family protein [Chloroflexota bacterium]
MSQVAILTDSSVQFTTPNFIGHEFVSIIPLTISLNGKVYKDGEGVKIYQLPIFANQELNPRVIPPTPDEFRQTFAYLWREHNEIITIVPSAQFNPAFYNAREAATPINGYSSVQIIDSQTTTVGLGLLIQAAAEAVANGANSAEVIRLLRAMIPRLYTVFYVQSLTYLFFSKYIDTGQAIIGELLEITPFLLMERGRLASIQKIRNTRHLVDATHEFLSEFNNLEYIGLIQGFPPFEHEFRVLRDRIISDFPNASFSEHTLNPTIATMIGPRSLGIVVLE